MKGTAVAILDDSDRLLLLKRSMKAHWMPGKWGLPGGKVEADETPIKCAQRETEEETTLHVQGLIPLTELSTPDVDIFYAPTYEGDVKLDFEHDDHVWVSLDELGEYDTTPNIGAIFRRAIKL